MRVEQLIPDLYGKNEEYINLIQDKYNKFKNSTEIPPVYINSYIDVHNLPKRLDILYNNFFEIVQQRFSYIFLFEDYDKLPYLANTLLDKYFRCCIENDKSVEQVLYLDTKILTEDMSKMGNKSNMGIEPSLFYKKETLYLNSEVCPLILWDGFSKIQTQYELNCIYKILLTRFRRNLGNVFFVEKGIDNLYHLGQRFREVINESCVVDCRNEHFTTKIYDGEGLV